MRTKLLITLLIISTKATLQAQDLPIKDTEKTVTVPEKTLQSYTGHYKINSMSLVVQIILDQGELYAEVAGMGKMKLVAGTQTAFAANDIQAQLEFTDIDSVAQGIRLFQGGTLLEGIRIDPPEEPDYEPVLTGSSLIDYTKAYSPFEAEYDLIINGKTVGSATIHLRHAIFNDQPAYHGGSVIRYQSMGNKPFADMGYFSKDGYRPLQARNAVSQEEEILSVHENNTVKQVTMNINTGQILETKTSELDQRILAGGIYKLLSMNLKEGQAIKFPVGGLNGLAWEKALVTGKETIQPEGMEQTFQTWKIAYSSGTIKWITNEAPYLIQWQMPTGMVWSLKHYNK